MPRKLTQEEVDLRLADIYDNEFISAGLYNGRVNKMDVKHQKCGLIFPCLGARLLDGKCLCPNCNSKSCLTLPGVNDLATLAPDICNLLVNKTDGIGLAPNSNQKKDMRCPNCGKVNCKSIGNVYQFGFTCSYCSDGISYPEKFVGAVLDQTKIHYITQFCPDWISPKKYDIYFELNNKKYIVEIDGAFHFRDNRINNTSFKVIQENDYYKQNEAEKRGYEFIRINANYSHMKDRFEIMTKGVIFSDLSLIIDLSIVDFVQCDKQANKSIVVKIAEDWNNNLRDCEILRNKYHVGNNTIWMSLKRASLCGLIQETPSEIVHITRSIGAKKRAEIEKIKFGQSVLCYETGEIFPSYKSASRKYHCNVRGYIELGNSYAGILPDGTKLTWQKIN